MPPRACRSRTSLREPDGTLRRAWLHGRRDLLLRRVRALQAYRGHGIGVGFFNEREAHARSLGRFRYATFCGVVRPADHPRRPKDYAPLDAFRRRRGYEPIPGLIGQLSWQDLDEDTESAKPMQFWIKRLT